MGNARNAGAVHRVSSPSRRTGGSSSAPGHPSGTQHQSVKTRAMHQSKTTWAGIQTKTIVEPVSGQIKGGQSQDRFRLRGLAQPPLLRLEISESPGFIRIPGFQPLPPGLGERATLFYRHTKRLCWSSKPFAELSCIAIFQFIPWDQLGQLDPAVVTREFPTKRQEEVFKTRAGCDAHAGTY